MYKNNFFAISLLLIFGYYNAIGQTVMVIKGTVTDSITNKPIEKAIITDGNSTMTSISDKDGKYTFYMEVSKAFNLIVKKEGYDTFERILEAADKAIIDVPLKKLVSRIGIMIDEIRTNQHISGRVRDLSPQDYNKYKILIYVLTDKWYIHPYATNEDGRGYASISRVGTWTISTIFRGNQAYLVAALLVKKDFVPPPVIDVYGDDSKSELLNKINPASSQIIVPPEGAQL